MCETLLGANKKKVGHILKYKAHILNYLRHLFAALKMRIFSGVYTSRFYRPENGRITRFANKYPIPVLSSAPAHLSVPT